MPPRRKALLGWAKRAFRATDSVNPWVLWLAFAAAGVCLVPLSFAVGNATWEYVWPDGVRKQVGFVYAPNWVVSFPILFPLGILFFSWALQDARAVWDALARRGMLVNSQANPIPAADANGKWTTRAGVCILVSFVLSLGPLVASFCEANSSLPQLRYVSLAEAKRGTANFSEADVDWSWMPLAEGDRVSGWGNAAFTYACFFEQAMVVAVFIAFFVLLVGFAALVNRYASGRGNVHLLPDLRSEDQYDRLGFEVLEPFCQNVLWMAICFAAAFFMTRLQRLYLHSNAATILDFVREDIVRGFVNGFGAIWTGNPDLFSTGKDLDYGTVMVTIGFCVLALAAFLLPAALLRGAARSAQQRMEDLIRQGRVSATSEQRRRLKGMKTWPLAYPRVMELTAYVVSALVCFVCYRLTLVTAGATGAWAVRRVWHPQAHARVQRLT